jgi:hypothetical protein
MKFERFRAYAESIGTRSQHVAVEDDEGVVRKERQVVSSWPTEDVAFAGEASGDGDMADLDAGKTVITKIVFYRGAPEAERAVASVEVGKAGKILVRCPDRLPQS